MITVMVTSTGKKSVFWKRYGCASKKVDAIKVSNNQNGTSHVILINNSSSLLSSLLPKMLIMTDMACYLVLLPLDGFTLVLQLAACLLPTLH